jgi:hypothetical protein
VSLGEKTFKNIPQPVRTFSITEAEGHGALPAPKAAGRLGVKWVATALLLVGAAGYWTYSAHERSTIEQARVRDEAAKQEAAQREARVTAERLAAEEAQRRAGVERQALEAARKEMQATAERAAAERRKTQPAGPVTAATSPPPRISTPVPTSPAAATDGVYAGPICYGPSPNDPSRCFRQ